MPADEVKADALSPEFVAWLNAPAISERGACSYCGIRIESATFASLAAWAHCNNCRVDLACKGHWSGRAADVLRAMWKRESKEDPRWKKLEALWG